MASSIGPGQVLGQRDNPLAKWPVHIINGVLWQEWRCHNWCFFSASQHLDKSDLAVADIAAAVPDGNLPVVLNPTLAAENVVDAGRHLVPLVVVSTPEWEEQLNVTVAPLDTALSCHCCCCCRVRVWCTSAFRQQNLTPADSHGWYPLERSPWTFPRTCSYTSRL